MKDMQKLKTLGHKLVILYVEDEEVIRLTMLNILNLFFDTVHIATNGEEGIKKFKEYNIDFIITDIKMPLMDGLTMLAEIRKINPTIPVVITSAFNDEQHFIESINLKVDRYLIKPMAQEEVKETLLSVATMIDDRDKARKLEINTIQHKINNMSEHIIAEIMNGYESPCIIYTNNEIKYINDTFCSLFNAEELSLFLENKKKIDSLFDIKDGFLSSLNNYKDNNLKNNKVSISKKSGRKIYRILKKQINLDGDNHFSSLYIFNDITLEEYQKIKIKSYIECLEELIFNNYYRRSKKKISNKEEIIILKKKKIENDVSSIKPINDEKLVINDMENSLLRRSHTNKTTAQEYVEELDYEVLQELQELDELDKDLENIISSFTDDKNIEQLHYMATKLEQYAHEISLLFEFEDLAYAIRSLSSLFTNIKSEQLNEKKLKKLTILISGIQYDLANWRNILFVEQSAIDIHYLDSSLFSACLQIELVLSDEIKEMESEEDDLILF